MFVRRMGSSEASRLLNVCIDNISKGDADRLSAQERAELAEAYRKLGGILFERNEAPEAVATLELPRLRRAS